MLPAHDGQPFPWGAQESHLVGRKDGRFTAASGSLPD
jgi:hypothetical protein